MGRETAGADNAELSAELKLYSRKHLAEMRLLLPHLVIVSPLYSPSMILPRSGPPLFFMQAIQHLLRGSEADVAYPVPINLLQLADCSPQCAQNLLQDAKGSLEELQIAILEEQENVMKSHSRDHSLTVKDLVRPRIVGEKAI